MRRGVRLRVAATLHKPDGWFYGKSPCHPMCKLEINARPISAIDQAEQLWPLAAQQALNDLRVKQTELEMQNDELRRTQTELDSQRAHYFDLYDLAPIGYCAVSDKGLILEVNLKAATLLGQPRSALIKEPLSHFVEKSSQDAYHLIFKHLLETGQDQSCEIQLVTGEGAPFWAKLMASVAQRNGIDVMRIILNNISERKRIELNLVNSQAELRSAQRLARIGNWHWDIATGVHSWSEEIFAIYGLSSDRIPVTYPDVQKYFTPQSWEELGVAVERCRTEGVPYKCDSELVWADDSHHWVSIFGSAVRDENSTIIALHGTLQDITERKLAQEKIHSLAFFDLLTGLPNRRLMMDRLQHILSASARHQQRGVLMLLDLDNFKALNDTLGHKQGDSLLQVVATRLKACVRDGDTVARFGGDEFIVILEDVGESTRHAATQAAIVGAKILASLGQVYQIGDWRHSCSASIGITLFGDQTDSADEILVRADLAMYRAKEAGRNTLCFFDHQMQADLSTRVMLEEDMREALEKHQFSVHYQAQVNIQGRITGVEALLRWRHPTRGLVSPVDFIPKAEKTGLILPLGMWVLETACAQLAIWASRAATAQLTLAVNVSSRQFADINFVDQVLATLDRSGANANLLTLELTESVLATNVGDVVTKMNALKAVGIRFSLDDFGTGYSSLSLIRRLPLDYLKIDQSFVRNILRDPDDAAIAKMVIVLADTICVQVIAEGVETTEQRDLLAELGCRNYQGYLFSQAVSAQEFEALVI